MRSRLPSQRALTFAGRAAKSQMGTTITVMRPDKPTFDATTGLMTAHDTTVIAKNIPARVYPVTGGGMSFLGSEDTVMRSTRISVMEDDCPTVRVGDRVLIVATLDDPALLNREFAITDVSLGGLMDPTRTLSVDAIEPNQFWTKA